MAKGKPENLTPMPPQGAQSFALQPLCVRVPVEIDAWVRSQPNPSEWLRRVIAEAVERDRLSD